MGDSGSDQYLEEDSDYNSYNPFLESDHGGDTPKTMSDYPTTESSPPDERSYSPKKNLLEEKSVSQSESDESKSDESTARSESVLEAFPDVDEDSTVLEAGRSQPVLEASTFRSESLLETSQSVFQNDLATVSSTSHRVGYPSRVAANRSLSIIPPPGNILGNRSSFLETLQTPAYRHLATVFSADRRVGYPFLRSRGAANPSLSIIPPPGSITVLLGNRSIGLRMGGLRRWGSRGGRYVQPARAGLVGVRRELLPAELAFGRVLNSLINGGISLNSLSNLREVILSGPANSLVEVPNLPVMYVVQRLNSIGQRKFAIPICDSHSDATVDIILDFVRDQVPDTPVFRGFNRLL